MRPKQTGDVQALPLGSQLVTAIQGKPVTTVPPAKGQAHVWNGTTFSPQTVPVAPYRKATSLQVLNSVAETDLLHGEITVAAGVMGSGNLLRLTAWGDSINNSASSQRPPRFKAKLGATTIFDTNIATLTDWNSNAARFGWRIVLEILNMGATNAQDCSISVVFGGAITAGDGAPFATGRGVYNSFANTYTGVGENNIAVDTTVAQGLALTVILPAANAALDITLKAAVVEII